MDSRTLDVAINAQLVTFGTTYRNAGVSRYTYALLSGLAAAPAPHQYTAFVNRAELAAAEASAPVASGRVRVLPAGWKTSHPASRVAWEQVALPGILRRLGADVFHSPVNVLPERLPCASVVTVHDLAFVKYPQYFRPARRVYQRTFTRRSVRAATRVVAVSESTRRDLIDAFGAAPERVRVIHPAIDGDFQPVEDAETRASFRARRNLPERYILFLGTLEPRKNLLVLLDAYARLRGAVGEAPPLVIAGAKGWYYDSVFARARALGLERSITFAGYVARGEQPLWYACAELFVYPSVYEGFGMPVVEALGCGTPTITSSVSSLPEAGGDLALTVDPRDAQGLAHAMQRMLADSNVRGRVRREGPGWAKRFSAARMAEAYVDVYGEAADARSAGLGKRGR